MNEARRKQQRYSTITMKKKMLLMDDKKTWDEIKWNECVRECVNWSIFVCFFSFVIRRRSFTVSMFNSSQHIHVHMPLTEVNCLFNFIFFFFVCFARFGFYYYLTFHLNRRRCAVSVDCKRQFVSFFVYDLLLCNHKESSVRFIFDKFNVN